MTGEAARGVLDHALCHCGQPLHYKTADGRAFMERIVAEYGEFFDVTADGRTWRVPRHYIALHGIQADNLPALGFAEVAVPVAVGPQGRRGGPP